MKRPTLGTVVLVLLAVLLPLLGSAAVWMPFDRFPGSEGFQRTFLVLDLPVALLNSVLPESIRSHMTYFLPCSHTYCFPDTVPVETARYLRVAVPAYLGLFFLPRLVVQRLRRDRPSN